MGNCKLNPHSIGPQKSSVSMEIPKTRRVKLVVMKLKGTTSVWWDQLNAKRQRQWKTLIRTWAKMKSLIRKKLHFPNLFFHSIPELSTKVSNEPSRALSYRTRLDNEFLKFGLGQWLGSIRNCISSKLGLELDQFFKTPRSHTLY